MIHTVKHLKYVLRVRQNELFAVLENIDRFYYKTESVKIKYGKPQRRSDGTFKTRTLHPSKDKLKDIQKRINKKILSQFPLPSFAYGSVKDKSNISNAQRHLENKYFLSVDLRNFFRSVTNGMVFSTFLSHHFSPTVARLLTQLTTYKGSLPQGAPTSPVLANLVFASTGQKLVAMTQPHQIIFTTYVDDFTFSSKAGFKFLVPEILSVIKADKYRLSHKKVSYKTKDPEINGIILSKNKLLPHPKILEKQQEGSNKQLDSYIARITQHTTR